MVCTEIGAHLVHVSTDYVFDGTKSAPYSPTDATNPINSYGKSKLAGEKAVTATMRSNWTIARTSWLYGSGGPNFIETMLRLAREGRNLKVVDDQTGTPTYTVDLARALADIAVGPPLEIIHATAEGSCNWFEFAKEIFKQSRVRPCSLAPCSSEDFPTPAARPANSRLSNQSLLDANISLLPEWRDGLQRYLLEIGIIKP
jgi:dTDP-4-dehydrorhamnose reductase